MISDINAFIEKKERIKLRSRKVMKRNADMLSDSYIRIVLKKCRSQKSIDEKRLDILKYRVKRLLKKTNQYDPFLMAVNKEVKKLDGKVIIPEGYKISGIHDVINDKSLFIYRFKKRSPHIEMWFQVKSWEMEYELEKKYYNTLLISIIS